MAKKVFICYRRRDSKWAARQLYQTLSSVLPPDHVFMDVDSIPPGVDFVDYLDGWVGQCDVLIVMIGPGWLEAKDPQTGRRQLDYELDFVRVEIRHALERGIPVVPVLLDGEPMPDPSRLPKDIRELTRRQALFVEDRTAEADMARLIHKLRLTEGGPTGPTEPAAPAGLGSQGRPAAPAGSGTQRRARTPPPRPDVEAVKPSSSPSFPVPRMIRIPAGSFTMGPGPSDLAGASSELPPHTVRFAHRFEIGESTVTFEEFDAFCERTNRSKPDDAGWGRERRPVIDVSYADAEAYVAWLCREVGPGWRLPSEAEWEYCCRAKTKGAFSFAGPISADVANYDAHYRFEGSVKGRFRAMTMPVATFRPNRWGLHEMHGNVWEWCADCWNDGYEGAPADGSAWSLGDCSQAVVRGGSWFNPPKSLRSAARYRYRRDERRNDLGFRVARTIRPDWAGGD